MRFILGLAIYALFVIIFMSSGIDYSGATGWFAFISMGIVSGFVSRALYNAGKY